MPATRRPLLELLRFSRNLEIRKLAGASLIAVLLGCLAVIAAMGLSGCGDDISIFVGNGGHIYFFVCDKSSGTWDVYNFLGGLGAPSLDSDTFNPSVQNCLDIQDDIIARSFGAATSANSVRNPARPNATSSATSTVEYMLDVGNYYAVQILDIAAQKITEVDLPGGGNAPYPVSMAMTPDGKSLWVLQFGVPPNSFGATPQPPGVSIMDTARQTFTGSFSLPLSSTPPEAIRFSPDGTTAYISANGATTLSTSGVAANSSVTVVDVASQKVTKTIPTPKGAGFEVMSPDGLILYTIFDNLGGSSSLTAIDTTTQTVAASVPLPDGSLKMFINPNGTRLYIYWFRGIDVFDTATLQQVASIPTVGFSLRNNFASFSANGRSAWFCNCGFGMYYNVDLATNKVVNTLQSQDLGHGLMFTVGQ